MATNTITPPKNTVPVGRVTIGGQTFDVQQHPEFVRFFFDLFRRIGGSTGPSNADLQTAIDELSGEVGASPTQSADVPQAFADLLLTPSVEPLPIPDTPNARLEALEARVELLFRAINDLQQGYQL